MSLRRGGGVMPAPVEFEIPENTPELQGVELFFANIDEPVQDYGLAIRGLRQACREALDDDSIRRAVLEDQPELNDHTNRHFQRWLTNAMKEDRDACRRAIVDARACAQVYVVDQDTEHGATIESLIATYQEQSQPENCADATQRHIARSWLAVFGAEKQRMEAEDVIDTMLGNYLESDAEAPFDILESLCADDFDTSEYWPFLTFLANCRQDPLLHDLIDDHFEWQLTEPLRMAPTYLAILNKCYSEDEDQRTAARELIGQGVLEWMDMFHNVVVVGEHKLAPSQLLSCVPAEEWPQEVQANVRELQAERIGLARASFRELTTPYIDKRNFLIGHEQFEIIINQGGKPHTSSKKKRSGKSSGSRITVASNLATLVGRTEDATELQNPISAIAQPVFASGNSKRVLAPTEYLIPDELSERQFYEGLLSLRAIQRYLAGQGDQLQRDVITMLHSLIRTPRGNGATKLTGAKMGLEQPGTTFVEQLPIWHLNPNKRSGLNVGDMGRQTRLYYLLPKAQEAGRATMLLLGLGHKTDYEHLRGRFIRLG